MGTESNFDDAVVQETIVLGELFLLCEYLRRQMVICCGIELVSGDGSSGISPRLNFLSCLVPRLGVSHDRAIRDARNAEGCIFLIVDRRTLSGVTTDHPVKRVFASMYRVPIP